MTPYFFVYLFLVAVLVAGLVSRQVRLAAIVAFVPMFVMIAGRGLVGVDSAFYVQQFDTIRYQGMLGGGFEPGFGLVVDLLTRWFADSFDILILLGCVAALLMLVAGLLLEKKPVFFMAIVLPFFLFDMTMNGLRYGLAFAIVALGAAALGRGRRSTFVVCCLVAATIQVSSVLLAAGAWALLEARLKTFALIAVAGTLVFAFFGSYLDDKVAQNADLTGLGGTAGLVPLAITMIVLGATAFNLRTMRDLRLPILILALLQLVAFGVSRYYYAGLRVQNIVLFMTYLVLAIKLGKSDFPVSTNKLLVTALLMAAVLSSALRLKNFSDEEGFGPSPFAPYYFATEIVA